MEYIIGASVMWVALAGLFTWYQTARLRKVKGILKVIIALPIVVAVWTFAILSLPFIRDAEVIYDNTPSSPEGEFRFGEE